jgi:hypothetical protein
MSGGRASPSGGGLVGDGGDASEDEGGGRQGIQAGDSGGAAGAFLQKDVDEVLEEAEVMTSKEWMQKYAEGDVNKEAELYELFVDVYRRFWKEGIHSASYKEVKEVEDPEGITPTESDPISQDELKLLQDEELGVTSIVPDEQGTLPSGFTSTKKRRDPIRRRLGLNRPLDALDSKVLKFHQVRECETELCRYIVRREKHKDSSGQGLIKVNEYVGESTIWVLVNDQEVQVTSTAPENQNARLKLRAGEPLAIAYLYHLKSYSDNNNSDKAREFFYLAHFASHAGLKEYKKKNQRPGSILLNTLKDTVIGNIPCFLELDPTDRVSSLADYYMAEHFHNAKEMRDEKSPEWLKWKDFLENASKRAWTTVFAKYLNPPAKWNMPPPREFTYERENIFGTNMMDATNNMWMVYWKLWPQPVVEPQTISNEDMILLEAAYSSDLRIKVLLKKAEDSTYEERPKNCTPQLELEDLLCMEAHEWNRIYTPSPDRWNALQEDYVNNILVPPKPSDSIPFDQMVAKPIQPQSIDTRSSFTGIYKRFVLVAPSTGSLHEKKGQPAIVPRVSSGDILAYCFCIIMKNREGEKISTHGTPNMLFITQMHASEMDIDEDRSDTLFTILMSRIIYYSTYEILPIIIDTNYTFNRKYGLAMSALGFAGGSKNMEAVGNNMGSAFLKYFQTIPANDRSTSLIAENGSLFTFFGSRLPLKDPKWKFFWGWDAVDLDLKHPNGERFSWRWIMNPDNYPQRDERASKEYALAMQTICIANDAFPEKESLILLTSSVWGARVMSNREDSKQQEAMKALLNLMQSYYSFCDQSSSIEYTNFMWGREACQDTLTRNYKMRHSFWIMCSTEDIIPYGFARTYDFIHKHRDYRNFSYIREAYVDKRTQRYFFPCLIELLAKAIGSDVPFIMELLPLNKNNHSAMKKMYKTANFEEGEALKSKSKSQVQSVGNDYKLLRRFFRCLSWSLDTAVILPSSEPTILDVDVDNPDDVCPLPQFKCIIDNDPSVSKNWMFRVPKNGITSMKLDSAFIQQADKKLNVRIFEFNWGSRLFPKGRQTNPYDHIVTELMINKEYTKLLLLGDADQLPKESTQITKRSLLTHMNNLKETVFSTMNPDEKGKKKRLHSEDLKLSKKRDDTHLAQKRHISNEEGGAAGSSMQTTGTAGTSQAPLPDQGQSGSSSGRAQDGPRSDKSFSALASFFGNRGNQGSGQRISGDSQGGASVGSQLWGRSRKDKSSGGHGRGKGAGRLQNPSAARLQGSMQSSQ